MNILRNLKLAYKTLKTAQERLDSHGGIKTRPSHWKPRTKHLRAYNRGEQRECDWCGEPYTIKRGHQRFCCDRHRNLYHNARRVMLPDE